jgi:hypothetical protein
MSERDESITLPASKVAGLLAAIAVCLVVVGTASQAVKFSTGRDRIYGLSRLFDLDKESNIPTFFSATVLVSASGILGVIAAVKRRASAPQAWHWTILAFFFLYLGLDEFVGIHEYANRPVRNAFGAWATGGFYFAWVIPGLALVVVLAAAYMKFWWNLPTPTRGLVFVAGALYIAGALGFEIVGGRYAEQHGRENAAYVAIASIEESLEMAGAILFVFAMLDYIQRNVGAVRFRFGAEDWTGPLQERTRPVLRAKDDGASNLPKTGGGVARHGGNVWTSPADSAR